VRELGNARLGPSKSLSEETPRGQALGPCGARRYDVTRRPLTLTLACACQCQGFSRTGQPTTGNADVTTPDRSRGPPSEPSTWCGPPVQAAVSQIYKTCSRPGKILKHDRIVFCPQSLPRPPLPAMQFLLPAAILALVAAAVAVPAPPVDAASASSHHALAKRVTHTGRVSAVCGFLISHMLTYRAQGTYFDVGLGNCGWHNVNSDLIVAISKDRYDDANGSNCGQYIHITNTANGHTTWVKTVDSCPGCGYNDLGMRRAVFMRSSCSRAATRPLAQRVREARLARSRRAPTLVALRGQGLHAALSAVCPPHAPPLSNVPYKSRSLYHHMHCPPHLASSAPHRSRLDSPWRPPLALYVGGCIRMYRRALSTRSRTQSYAARLSSWNCVRFAAPKHAR
jgi:hypothetical protein